MIKTYNVKECNKKAPTINICEFLPAIISIRYANTVPQKTGRFIESPGCRVIVVNHCCVCMGN